jgi:hypothetical protein
LENPRLWSSFDRISKVDEAWRSPCFADWPKRVSQPDSTAFFKGTYTKGFQAFYAIKVDGIIGGQTCGKAKQVYGC